MTWVLYPTCSMACAPKGHSLQGLRIRFCSNVFWRVKQQIWYSREVFSEPRLHSHLLKNVKKRPWFWGFISSMGSFIAFHIPDRWSRVQNGFDQISPSRIDNDKLYRATLTSPGDDVYLAREGCWDIINSQTAWVRVGLSSFLKWRPSGFVKIGKIEGILTSEQTPLWYRWK